MQEELGWRVGRCEHDAAAGHLREPARVEASSSDEATLALSTVERAIDATFDPTKSSKSPFGPVKSIGPSLEEEIPKRQDNKRTPVEKPSIFESIDAAAERLANPEEVAPWHVQQIADRLPVVQAALKPADYATRKARKMVNVAQDADRENQRFGLPDWSEGDYVMLDPEDTPWEGDNLYDRLGLHMVVNPLTAVHLLCLMQKKSDLPQGVAPQQLLSFANKAKRSDHINVLRCVDVAEDDERIYVLHEYIPCTTLACLLDHGEHESWTEETMANLSREVTAALAYMSQYFGIHHLGMSLNHVLVPLGSLRQEFGVTFAKVYGFGLVSLVYTLESQLDRSCLTPEVFAHMRGKGAGRKDVLSSLSPGQVTAQDVWAVGVITYAILSGRVPFLVDVEEDMDLQEMASDLLFPPIFDTIASEARELIESLLVPVSARPTLHATKRCPWYRKMWRTERSRTEEVFEKLERFCTYSEARRCFGRFLARFLDPKGQLKAARWFYDLDINGDGYLTIHDLVVVAKNMHKRKDLPNEVIAKMGCTADHISFTLFAACMAEAYIEGRTLRLAFESIDEDGSELITPAELHEQLRLVNPKIGLQDVIEYIASVEDGAEGTSDHALDFEEFANLFPESVQRRKLMDERLESSRSQRATLVGQFEEVHEDITSWMGRLEGYRKVFQDQKGTAIESFKGDEQRTKACDKIRSSLYHAHECLSNPPGLAKHDKDEEDRVAKQRNRKHKKHEPILFGFDTFLADRADHQEWNALLKADYEQVAKSKQKTVMQESDFLRVYTHAELAETKLLKVLQWTRDQIEEYSSFTESFESERRLPKIARSGRGLVRSKGDDADEGHEPEVLEGTSSVLPTLFWMC